MACKDNNNNANDKERILTDDSVFMLCLLWWCISVVPLERGLKFNRVVIGQAMIIILTEKLDPIHCHTLITISHT